MGRVGTVYMVVAWGEVGRRRTRRRTRRMSSVQGWGREGGSVLLKWNERMEEIEGE
jgi:hypothetical protein